MPVIKDGKTYPLNKAQGPPSRGRGRTIVGIYTLPHRTIAITSNRKTRVLRVEADLGVVQEHFGGLSRSEALRISLALTATAIRAGQMAVKVAR